MGLSEGRSGTMRARSICRRPRAIGPERCRWTSAPPAHLHSRWVFWHHEGQRSSRISNQFSATVRRAIKRKLIDRPFRFHDLRHWFAVDYLRRGGNIYDLQKELGHSSIQTTEMYLDFLTPEQQRGAKFGAGTIPGTETTVRNGDTARNDG